MSYKVKTIDVFEKQAKRLIKKYVSLKTELFQLVQELKENPEQGTAKPAFAGSSHISGGK
jgi:mRNA-degrading endonuclease RelE of RelBE toxin-antitoxin system